MLKPIKLYPCIQCGKMVKVRSKGLCPYCRNLQKPIATKSKGTNNIRLKDISNFFEEILPIVSHFSVESGIPITNISKWNLCHILPKRTYHSVETNILNIVVLTCDEHSRFDQLLDRRDSENLLKEFPNTCKEVKKRLSLLSNTITEKDGSLYNFLLNNL